MSSPPPAVADGQSRTAGTPAFMDAASAVAAADAASTASAPSPGLTVARIVLNPPAEPLVLPASATSSPATTSPAQPSTGRFIIKPRTPITHAQAQPQRLTPPGLASPPGISSPSAATTPTAAEGATLQQQNAAQPLQTPSPALLAQAAAAAAASNVSPEALTLASPSAIVVSDPQYSPNGTRIDVPSSHPTAWVRPPTPPSRRAVKSPGAEGEAGAGGADDYASPGEEVVSGKDKFNAGGMAAPAFNPNSSMLPPSRPILQQGMSFDVSGSEFSAALRAALSEAGASTGTGTIKAKRGRSPRVTATEFGDVAGGGGGNGGDGAAASGAQAGSSAENAAAAASPNTPTDESTERELRKQAIRQKNAMHMRIRNASVSQANAAASARARAAAAGGGGGNAALPLPIAEPNTPVRSPGGAIRRAMTMQSPRSDVEMQHLNPEQQHQQQANIPLTPSKPTSLAAFLTGVGLPAVMQSPPAGKSAAHSSTDAPKRTLSSILKPTPPLNSQGLAIAPEASPKGVLRTTSMQGGVGGGARGSFIDSAVAVPSSGPALQRTGTFNSRVGFAPKSRVGEGGESDLSASSSSDDEDDAANVRNANTAREPSRNQRRATAQQQQLQLQQQAASKAADDAAAASAGTASMRTKKGGAPSPFVTGGGGGTAAEVPTVGRSRKEIFSQEGSQLVLRSVSTVHGGSHMGAGGGGSQSHQAANVMVLSVSSIFTRLRLYTDLCFVLATIGVLLTVLNKELRYNYPLAARGGPSEEVYWAIVIVRSLSSLSTALLIFCLYRYYQADFQFLQLNRVYLLRSAFWNTQLAWSFALEVLICLVHEPPFLDHDVDMSIADTATFQSGAYLEGETNAMPVVVRNPWSLLIALRFYVFLRLILSRYYTGGTKILGLWFNFNFNIPFAIRNMLYSHPLLSLAPVVCMLIFSCSYSLWVFEREAADRHFSFGTALWVVMITITAVGYGDVTPLSSGGRAICIISAFIGIILVAVLVAAVHQKLTLLPYEGRMVEFLERDSNSTALKFYAARCISRSWKYYHYRSKAVTLLRAGKFGFVSRSTLLLHKSVMLQGIFDFQTARKQIQAYDRRYHSEQLFRSMLEGLYDKLENMTLDFHVLEEEMDLSYEEQRKMASKQSEILDEVRSVAAGGGGGRGATANASAAAPGAKDASATATGSIAPPAGVPAEQGRLSLLRPRSLTHIGAAADTSGRTSASVSEDAVGSSAAQYKGAHKSLRNSAVGGVSSAAVTRTNSNEADLKAADTKASPSKDVTATVAEEIGSQSSRRGAPQLNSGRRASLNLDLVAAAASVAASHAPGGGGNAHPAARVGVPRGTSTHDLTGVTVETPRGIDQHQHHLTLGPAGSHSSLASLRASRRTTLQKHDSALSLGGVGGSSNNPSPGHNVTNDLLAVVEALGTDMPSPAAGRIRFGEADFGVHRAVSVRPNRGTILLQRNKSMISGAATPSGAGGGGVGGDHHTHAGLLSLRHGFPRPGSIELPAGSPTLGHFHSQALETPSTAGERPGMSRAGSGGGALRAQATARVAAAQAGAAPVTNDQFERMMLLLANIGERVGSVEAALAHDKSRSKATADGSPRKSPLGHLASAAPSSHYAVAHSYLGAGITGGGSSTHIASGSAPTAHPQLLSSPSATARILSSPSS